MRSIRRPASLAAPLVAMAAVAISTAAAADGGHPRAHAAKTRSFTLQQPNDIAEFVDLGASGPSAGDRLFFNGSLLDARGERNVGSQRGSCETVQLAAGALHCYLTVRFGGAATHTVEAAGEFFLNPDGTVTRHAVFSIVGGTGRYQGSSGQIRITNLGSDGAKAREDWTLRTNR